jgi:hypothetical protein
MRRAAWGFALALAGAVAATSTGCGKPAAISEPSDVIENETAEILSESWVTEASLCGGGDSSACARANAIARISPEAPRDRCANGDPRNEDETTCRLVGTAREEGLLE